MIDDYSIHKELKSLREEKAEWEYRVKIIFKEIEKLEKRKKRKNVSKNNDAKIKRLKEVLNNKK